MKLLIVLIALATLSACQTGGKKFIAAGCQDTSIVEKSKTLHLCDQY